MTESLVIKGNHDILGMTLAGDSDLWGEKQARCEVPGWGQQPGLQSQVQDREAGPQSGPWRLL